ncbi:hypothetical protein KUF71_020985 [Frankliniella fusca]|uniref:PH domain-containing protein n=1 Tax=Frankliniella fusca TaxID=407009 RepID=A0AAE1I0Q4_9NEOP|nr:hypothetical protein KUF71_020985 [Frankliniella fusca]
MASDVDTLLHDVLVFMQQLLQQQALPPESQDELRALVARLRQADGAYRPSYLDMKGTLSLRRMHPGLAEPQSPTARWSDFSAAGDDTDSGARQRTTSADSGDLDTSADCSECLDDSNDDWPPRGVSSPGTSPVAAVLWGSADGQRVPLPQAPTCLRPDLSPDWAVSAAAARGLALHCGAVYRAAPGRWFRRRGWAALLPAPARLLVFSGARSSRPRLVLLLAPLAPAPAAPGPAPAPPAPCCDPCCAVYAARPRHQGPAFELCCPGRKTHQLWVSDEKEAQAWVEAIRRAPQQQPEQPSVSTASSPSPPPAPSADGDSHGASDGTPVGIDPSARSGSRSVSFVSETHRASCAEVPAPARAPQDVDQAPPPPPLTPPPPPAPEDLQQEYESMMAGSEEIYHDIGSPEPAIVGAGRGSPHQALGLCPSYANLQLLPGAASIVPGETVDSAEAEDPDDQTKPDLYDDVAAHPLAPEYCNVGRDPDEDHALGEHLYDDIGPTETRTSVYELIQEPNQKKFWKGVTKTEIR